MTLLIIGSNCVYADSVLDNHDFSDEIIKLESKLEEYQKLSEEYRKQNESLISEIQTLELEIEMIKEQLVIDPTRENSEIMYYVDQYYNNAWNKLIWLIGLIGVLVPGGIEFLRRRDFKINKDEVMGKVDEMIKKTEDDLIDFTSESEKTIKRNVEQLESKLDYELQLINSNTNQNTKSIENATTEQNTIKVTILKQNDAFNQLGYSVNELKSRISDTEYSITDLDSRLDIEESYSSSFESDIDDLMSRIDDLESESLADRLCELESDDLESRIEEFESRIDDYESRVEDLEGEDFSSTISELDSRVEEIENGDFESKIYDIETKLDEIIDRIDY